MRQRIPNVEARESRTRARLEKQQDRTALVQGERDEARLTSARLQEELNTAREEARLAGVTADAEREKAEAAAAAAREAGDAADNAATKFAAMQRRVAQLSGRIGGMSRAARRENLRRDEAPLGGIGGELLPRTVGERRVAEARDAAQDLLDELRLREPAGLGQLEVEVVEDADELVERVGGAPNLDRVEAEAGDGLLELMHSEVINRAEAVLLEELPLPSAIAWSLVLQQRLEGLVGDVLREKGAVLRRVASLRRRARCVFGGVPAGCPPAGGATPGRGSGAVMPK